MVNAKANLHRSVACQLGIFTAYILIILTSPFFMRPKTWSYDAAQFSIFFGKHSLYHDKEFEGLIHSYFTISLILLIVLPVLAIFFQYILNKMGYPLLAHLQSLLIFVACSLILIFTMFSLTVQKDLLRLYWGFYLCQAFYWIFILREWWHLSGMVDKRNQSLDDARAEEKEQPAE